MKSEPWGRLLLMILPELKFYSLLKFPQLTSRQLAVLYKEISNILQRTTKNEKNKTIGEIIQGSRKEYFQTITLYLKWTKHKTYYFIYRDPLH